MTNATFTPKNKSLYKGKHGRLLMSKAGQPCVLQGTTTYPAEQTRDRRPYEVAFIRFPNSAVPFVVRACDVTGA